MKDYKEFMEDAVKTCAEKLPTDRLDVRKERTAFMMDVKGMFHQFFVSKHHKGSVKVPDAISQRM